VTEGRVVEGRIKTPDSVSDDSENSRIGYRIQVVATRFLEEAERDAELVKGLYTVAVYIEYYEPFYKVRVGDFKTRQEAEKMKEKLVEIGFDSAWILETIIATE
jgi:hypothetical protein